jgi:DNA-directed RNA polymerase specialized sigma24 family protein
VRSATAGATARGWAGLEAYRSLLFSIAYRMLGEVGLAKDVVQEAFLRAHRAMRQGMEIRDPPRFLPEAGHANPSSH